MPPPSGPYSVRAASSRLPSRCASVFSGSPTTRSLNTACWDAVAAYTAHLVSPDPIVTRFHPLTLEDVFARLAAAGATDAAALHARYLDFERLIDLIIAAQQSD